MPNQPAEVRLIVLTGAKVGEEIHVETEACLGRLAECDLVLDDKLASRKHAQVRVGPEGVYLQDLGSSNGTRLHDERIQEARLEDGDQFEIGHTRIRVRIQPGEAPAAKVVPQVQPQALPQVQAQAQSPRPQAQARVSQTQPGLAKGKRGRGGALQYHRVEDRGGLLGEDLWQRSGLSRILLLALVLAVGAGLFFLTYHAVS